MANPLETLPMTNQPRSLFENIEPDVMTRIAARGDEVAQGASVNSKIGAALALGSLPIAFAALASDVYSQSTTPTAVLDALNFALTLEFLESSFYTQGVNASGLIAAADATVFATIKAHEAAHVTALQSLITALGGTPTTSPTFDFTLGGSFSFSGGSSQYPTFLALAQAFEDTGVRAYKGQAPALMPSAQALEAGLAIHAVEAEHASMVRRLRGQKGWISGAYTDISIATATYVGEDNLVQGGVNISTLATAEAANFPGITVSTSASWPATEAFDEPLDKASVLAIASQFIVSTP